MKDKKVKKIIDDFLKEHGEELSEDIKNFTKDFDNEYTSNRCEIIFSTGKKGIEKLIVAGEKSSVLAGIATILYSIWDEDDEEVLRYIHIIEETVRMRSSK